MSTGRGRWVGKLMRELQPADEDDLMQEIMFVMWRYRDKALTKTCPILYLACKTSYKAQRFLKGQPLVRNAGVTRLKATMPAATTNGTPPDIWDWVPDEVRDHYYGTGPSSGEEARITGKHRSGIYAKRRKVRDKVLDCLRKDPVFCDTYA